MVLFDAAALPNLRCYRTVYLCLGLKLRLLIIERPETDGVKGVKGGKAINFGDLGTSACSSWVH